jgi:hypothetical protein
VQFPSPLAVVRLVNDSDKLESTFSSTRLEGSFDSTVCARTKRTRHSKANRTPAVLLRSHNRVTSPAQYRKRSQPCPVHRAALNHHAITGCFRDRSEQIHGDPLALLSQTFKMKFLRNRKLPKPLAAAKPNDSSKQVSLHRGRTILSRRSELKVLSFGDQRTSVQASKAGFIGYRP